MRREGGQVRRERVGEREGEGVGRREGNWWEVKGREGKVRRDEKGRREAGRGVGVKWMYAHRAEDRRVSVTLDAR